MDITGFSALVVLGNLTTKLISRRWLSVTINIVGIVIFIVSLNQTMKFIELKKAVVIATILLRDNISMNLHDKVNLTTLLIK